MVTLDDLGVAITSKMFSVPTSQMAVTKQKIKDLLKTFNCEKVVDLRTPENYEAFLKSLNEL